ncbi:MAG: hypothetical protein U0136_12905 [Bdellovibrionota bacterium]
MDDSRERKSVEINPSAVSRGKTRKNFLTGVKSFVSGNLSFNKMQQFLCSVTGWETQQILDFVNGSFHPAVDDLRVLAAWLSKNEDRIRTSGQEALLCLESLALPDDDLSFDAFDLITELAPASAPSSTGNTNPQELQTDGLQLEEATVRLLREPCVYADSAHVTSKVLWQRMAVIQAYYGLDLYRKGLPMSYRIDLGTQFLTALIEAECNRAISTWALRNQRCVLNRPTLAKLRKALALDNATRDAFAALERLPLAHFDLSCFAA